MWTRTLRPKDTIVRPETAAELIAPTPAMQKRGGLRVTREIARMLDGLDGETSANMRAALALGLPKLIKARDKANKKRKKK